MAKTVGGRKKSPVEAGQAEPPQQQGGEGEPPRLSYWVMGAAVVLCTVLALLFILTWVSNARLVAALEALEPTQETWVAPSAQSATMSTFHFELARRAADRRLEETGLSSSAMTRLAAQVDDITTQIDQSRQYAVIKSGSDASGESAPDGHTLRSLLGIVYAHENEQLTNLLDDPHAVSNLGLLATSLSEQVGGSGVDAVTLWYMAGLFELLAKEIAPAPEELEQPDHPLQPNEQAEEEQAAEEGWQEWMLARDRRDASEHLREQALMLRAQVHAMQSQQRD